MKVGLTFNMKRGESEEGSEPPGTVLLDAQILRTDDLVSAPVLEDAVLVNAR